MINISGTNCVSIHRLTPVELGLTVGSIGEVLKNNMFQMDAITLHKGLSRQDRALWRTRIVATAMDLAKSVSGGQKVVRPRVPETKSRKSPATTPVTAALSKKGIDPNDIARFTTKYASDSSIAAVKKRDEITERSKSSNTASKITAFPEISSPKSASKVFRESNDLVEIVHIDTNKMYASSSETGRKWMIGIFAAPTMNNDTAPTSLVSGEGALHSRRVNFNSPVFFLESKDSNTRKRLLRAEIEMMHKTMAIMSEEGPRKPLPASPVQDSTPGSAAKRQRLESSCDVVKKTTSSMKKTVNVSERNQANEPAPKKRVRLSAEELELKYTVMGKKKPGPKGKRPMSSESSGSASNIVSPSGQSKSIGRDNGMPGESVSSNSP
jgi:hypothetical protein